MTSEIAYIESFISVKPRLGLRSISKLIEKLGNPQNSTNFIHIAGTNGKGSTGAIISSILQSYGKNVGLFSSPHLESFCERIQINDENISKDSIEKAVWNIKPHIDYLHSIGEKITFFELMTTIAIYHFSVEKVDYAILEAGLGGSRDATNFVIPKVSVITTISRDHTHILGGTIKEIAKEKAGIIKHGIPVVTSAIGPALSIIKKAAYESNCELKIAKNYKIIHSNRNKQIFNLDGLKELEIHLLGEHQVINAATAVATAQVLDIPEYSIREGLKNTFWPGRFEIVSMNPITILDGAHNPEAMTCFVKTYRKLFNKPPIMILGVKRSKKIKSMINKVARLAKHIIITDSQFQAMPAHILRKEIVKFNNNVEIIHDAREAVTKARNLSKSDDIICITGSLYLAGDVRDMFHV